MESKLNESIESLQHVSELSALMDNNYMLVLQTVAAIRHEKNSLLKQWHEILMLRRQLAVGFDRLKIHARKVHLSLACQSGSQVLAIMWDSSTPRTGEASHIWCGPPSPGSCANPTSPRVDSASSRGGATRDEMWLANADIARTQLRKAIASAVGLGELPILRKAKSVRDQLADEIRKAQKAINKNKKTDREAKKAAQLKVADDEAAATAEACSKVWAEVETKRLAEETVARAIASALETSASGEVKTDIATACPAPVTNSLAGDVLKTASAEMIKWPDVSTASAANRQRRANCCEQQEHALTADAATPLNTWSFCKSVKQILAPVSVVPNCWHEKHTHAKQTPAPVTAWALQQHDTKKCVKKKVARQVTLASVVEEAPGDGSFQESEVSLAAGSGGKVGKLDMSLDPDTNAGIQDNAALCTASMTKAGSSKMELCTPIKLRRAAIKARKLKMSGGIYSDGSSPPTFERPNAIAHAISTDRHATKLEEEDPSGTCIALGMDAGGDDEQETFVTRQSLLAQNVAALAKVNADATKGLKEAVDVAADVSADAIAAPPIKVDFIQAAVERPDLDANGSGTIGHCHDDKPHLHERQRVDGNTIRFTSYGAVHGDQPNSPAGQMQRGDTDRANVDVGMARGDAQASCPYAEAVEVEAVVEVAEADAINAQPVTLTANETRLDVQNVESMAHREDVAAKQSATASMAIAREKSFACRGGKMSVSSNAYSRVATTNKKPSRPPHSQSRSKTVVKAHEGVLTEYSFVIDATCTPSSTVLEGMRSQVQTWEIDTKIGVGGDAFQQPVQEFASSGVHATWLGSQILYYCLHWLWHHLYHDTYLCQQIKPGGWISLHVLARFNRCTYLSVTWQMIEAACANVYPFEVGTGQYRGGIRTAASMQIAQSLYPFRQLARFPIPAWWPGAVPPVCASDKEIARVVHYVTRVMKPEVAYYSLDFRGPYCCPVDAGSNVWTCSWECLVTYADAWAQNKKMISQGWRYTPRFTDHNLTSKKKCWHREASSWHAAASTWGQDTQKRYVSKKAPSKGTLARETEKKCGFTLGRAKPPHSHKSHEVSPSTFLYDKALGCWY